MANRMMEQARRRQDDKRAREKDPADLSGAQEPDWDNPSSWQGGTADPGTAEADASDSTSDAAGDSAGDTAGENASGKAASTSRRRRSDQAAKKPRTEDAAAPRRAPRRPGRPRGPERVALSVRILAANDRRLTAAVNATGHNPQTIVDEALEAYFRRNKITDPQEPS